MAVRVTQRMRNRMPLADDQTRDMGIAFHIAYDLMRDGRGDEEQWSTLACMIDIAVTLAQQGTGSEHLDELRAALDGIHRAKVRGDATGKWAFDGDALRAMETALAIHDAQLAVTTVGEALNAIAEVERQIF